MGNSLSVEEQVLKSAAKNNCSDLQALIAEHGRDPAARRTAINVKDKEGRTPLLIAATKNYHNMAKLLLDNGADVHYVNCTKDSEGSALHEAAHRGHEAMVELLLQYGANPFLCNIQQRTPLDLAVMESHGNIIRRFIQAALFAGSMNVKWSAMAGLSSVYKRRYLVVLQHFPCPKDGQGAAVRKQLWIFKDAASCTPRVRLWLDGATAYKSGEGGLDGIVRLHTSHPQPAGSVFSRYDRGYCVFVRPASPANAPVNTPPIPPAIDAYELMMSLCNLQESIPAVGQANSGAGTAVARGNSGVQAAAVPTFTPSVILPSPPHYPSVPIMAANGGTFYPPSMMTSAASTAAPVTLQQRFDSAGGASTMSYASSGTAGGPAGHYNSSGGGASSLWGANSVVSSSGGSAAAGAGVAGTPSLPPRTSASGQQGTRQSPYRAPGTPDDWISQMQAAPNETDDEFAARLASAMSVGAPQPAPLPPLPPLFAGHRAGATPAAAPASAANSARDTTPRERNASPAATATVSSPHGTHTWYSPAAGTAPAAASPASKTASPSAPPLSARSGAEASTTGNAGAGNEGGDDSLCVICLSAERTAGFLHGVTVHRCVCGDCSKMVPPGAPCPLCRQPVERVLGVY